MRCRGRTRAFDYAYPLFPYSGRARDLISAYKKGGRRSLAIPLAAIADRAISKIFPGLVIVPVPPRPGKIARLGWDQVEQIARELGRMGHRIERLLVRKAAAEQKLLGRELRAANARASFALRPGAKPPRHILLLDDVITTGATVDACAAALKAGGARSVRVLALAAD